MKKAFNLSTVITGLVFLVPLGLSAYFYERLPDKVATHWGFNGAADGYSGKAFAAFGLPLILLVLHIVVCFAIENDPKRTNMPSALKIICKCIMPLMCVLVQSVVIINGLGYAFNPANYIIAFVGVLFCALGIYMPKCRLNYTIGIRVPWTLHSEDIWDKTHRIAGRLWTAGGVIVLVSAFFPRFAPWVLVAAIIPMSVVPAIYSYLLYRKKEKREN